MKGFVLGAAVGVILGSAVSASALSGWYSGAELMEASRPARSGYAAGAGDMLDVVVSLIESDGAEFATSWFKKQSRCLDSRSGGRLGQFTDFAETHWRGRTTQAASILLDRACD
jgi:hypothetical protein